VVELAVYFCRVEALENTAKHAGPDSSVAVGVPAAAKRFGSRLRTRVSVFDSGAERLGGGLTLRRDRIGAVGGRATISCTGGRGTSISGRVPVP
jgi:glucose-6-phosphate-specific signal transduction histidine kinase